MRDIVLHRSGLKLDFAKDDFGGELQEAVVNTWLKERRVDRGDFICWEHRAHEKPWLYLRTSGDLLVACHWPGSALADTHTISHGGRPSPEHERQAEYIKRAGAAAGFPVNESRVQLSTKVIPDAVIYGPTTMSVEAQRSYLNVRDAKARTTKARKAGVLPIWFSDSGSDPKWIFNVPGVRMNEQRWDTLPRARSVTVVSGTRIIVPQRCRDIRNSPCPNARLGCNEWHPTHQPRLRTTVDDLAELVPAGELIPILFRRLSGRKEDVLIVNRSDKALYEAMVGRPADLPLVLPNTASHAGSRRSCSADAGALARAPEESSELSVHRFPEPCIGCGKPVRCYNAADQPQCFRCKASQTLNWQRHATGPGAPCRRCGGTAFMRDADGTPMHKTCAEQELE